MAEALLNRHGQGRFRAFSAGSYPRGEVHSLALRVLRQRGLPDDGLRSRSWDEFAKPGAPVMNFIFTVCDRAAGEVCPVWPGQPMTAHWGMADPGNIEGTEAQRVRARSSWRRTNLKLASFPSWHCPPEELDRMSLKQRLDEIGHNRTGDHR